MTSLSRWRGGLTCRCNTPRQTSSTRSPTSYSTKQEARARVPRTASSRQSGIASSRVDGLPKQTLVHLCFTLHCSPPGVDSLSGSVPLRHDFPETGQRDKSMSKGGMQVTRYRLQPPPAPHALTDAACASSGRACRRPTPVASTTTTTHRRSASCPSRSIQRSGAPRTRGTPACWCSQSTGCRTRTACEKGSKLSAATSHELSSPISESDAPFGARLGDRPDKVARSQDKLCRHSTSQ